MEFALLPDIRDVRLQMMTALSIVFAALVGSWLLVIFGRINAETALGFIPFGAIITPAIVVLLSRTRFGVFVVNSEGIVLRKGIGGVAQAKYRWADIASLAVVEEPGITLPGVASLAALAGVPRKNRFVAVQLLRTPRLGLWPLKGGTSAHGIPLGSRTLRLPTPNPTEVSTFAHRFLSAEASQPYSYDGP